MVKRPTTPICGVGLLIWFREWKLSKRPSWQVKHNGTTDLLCSSKIYFFSQTLPNFCLIKSYFVQITLEWGVYQKAVIQLQTAFERSVNPCLTIIQFKLTTRRKGWRFLWIAQIYQFNCPSINWGKSVRKWGKDFVSLAPQSQIVNMKASAKSL